MPQFSWERISKNVCLWCILEDTIWVVLLVFVVKECCDLFCHWYSCLSLSLVSLEFSSLFTVLSFTASPLSLSLCLQNLSATTTTKAAAAKQQKKKKQPLWWTHLLLRMDFESHRRFWKVLPKEVGWCSNWPPVKPCRVTVVWGEKVGYASG